MADSPPFYLVVIREQQARLVLSNSFGFGGTNAALVLRAGEPA